MQRVPPKHAHYISVEGDQLHYVQYGSGPRVMLCFHGFGQDEVAFLPFVQRFHSKFTFFCFDLFGHGKSRFYSDHRLSLEVWEQLMGHFFDRHEIGQFSLMGFSIGARAAHGVIAAFPHKVKEMLLVAPDGLTDHVVYKTLTGKSVLNKLFRRFVMHPGLYHQVLKNGTRFKMLSPSLSRNLSRVTNSPKKRLLVYRTWNTFAGFSAEELDIIPLMLKFGTRVMLFYNEGDALVNSAALKHWAGTMANCKLVHVNSPHHLQIRAAADYLELLNWPDSKSTSSSAHEAKL